MKSSIQKSALAVIGLLSLTFTFSCKTNFHIDENLKLCTNTMRQIEVAKRTLAMAHSVENGTLLSPEELQEIASYMPLGKWSAYQCASGGKYTVGRIGESPQCSVHGNLKDIRTYYQ